MSDTLASGGPQVASGRGHGRAVSRPKPPLIPEVGIISLVPERWGEPWTTRHHVLTRLARYFHVVWVDPAPYWRVVGLRDLIGGVFRGLKEREPRSGMFVLRANPLQPRVYRPELVSEWVRRRRLKRASELLRQSGADTQVLYLWRPEHAQAMDLINHSVSCYHIDDEYSFSPVEQPLDETELALIRRVDQVFVQSHPLLKKKGGLNTSTAHAPNGVDYAAYSKVTAEPRDLAGIPHPRIGYVGVIKKQLDLRLIVELAERRKDWSFVFVGPVLTIGDQSAHLARLQAMANVYLLGSKPVDSLPAYTQHLDVCLLCYKVDAYTDMIYPLKLNEYLATGRPVVGSRIDALEGLADVLALASSADEWHAAIEESLAPHANAVELVERRRAYARRHDWAGLVLAIARAIGAHLGESILARLPRDPGFELAPDGPIEHLEPRANS